MSGDAAVDAFLANPHIYEFFQAIRVLSRRLTGHGDTPSRFNRSLEPVTIGAHSSFSFPASDIQSVAGTPRGELRMRINMMGLTGVAGPLPHYYTSLILQANADLIPAGDSSSKADRRDTALEDFFDIFNHRLAYLFYYAWEKSRFPAAFERTGHDGLRKMLLALSGVPVPLPASGSLPEEFFLRFAPLLCMQPRSGEVLRSILASFFQVEVEVEQYAGTWRRLSPASLTRIGDSNDASGQLGFGTVAGNDYWSLDSMARIRIGPLSRETYDRFLPGADWNRTLREICRYFSGDEIEFEVQLVLDRAAVPFCERGLRLGWTTWLKSKPASSHRDGVVLRL